MSRRFRRWSALLAVLAVAALGAIAARGVIESRGAAPPDAGREGSGPTPSRLSVVNGVTVVTLDAATQRAAGIRTLALTNAPHRQLVRAYGSVLDLQKLTDLANSYAVAKAQLAVAEAKLAASQAAFERAAKLYKDRQNVSAADLQTANSAFRIDAAGHAAAAATLRTLALTAQQEWGPVLGAAVAGGGAPLDGLIAGQQVLLQVTLRPGQKIAEPVEHVSVRQDDGAAVALRFVSLAPKTDPRLQGPSLFFTAPAGSGLLPGQNVVALLGAGRPVEGAIVPEAAVVWEGGRAWAYFRTGATGFARRPVATDRRAPGGGYLVQGIADNAEIVVAGAQMLLSEEFRAQTGAGGQGDED